MKAKTTNNNATINNSNSIKEETIMMKRLEELVAGLTSNQKSSDAGYIKKDDLRVILNKEFNMGFSKRVTRDEMVQVVMNMYKDQLAVADEASYGNAVIVPAGDMSSDKYYPEAVVIDKKHGEYLVKNIVKASFIASKGDSKGKRIITMHKLFGIIRKAYANGDEKLEESFIKNIVNQLVTLKYISFKKYESGAMVFYPTVKASEFAKNNK